MPEPKCPYCDRMLTRAELAEGWCECGKKIPPFVTGDGASDAQEGAARASAARHAKAERARAQRESAERESAERERAERAERARAAREGAERERADRRSPARDGGRRAGPERPADDGGDGDGVVRLFGGVILVLGVLGFVGFSLALASYSMSGGKAFVLGVTGLMMVSGWGMLRRGTLSESGHEQITGRSRRRRR